MFVSKRFGRMVVTRKQVGDVLFVNAQGLDVSFDNIKAKLFFGPNVVTIMSISGLFLDDTSAWNLHLRVMDKFPFKAELLEILGAKELGLIRFYEPSFCQEILQEIMGQNVEMKKALDDCFSPDISEKVMKHFACESIRELLAA